jgi:hypothetical protein
MKRNYAQEVVTDVMHNEVPNLSVAQRARDSYEDACEELDSLRARVAELEAALRMVVEQYGGGELTTNGEYTRQVEIRIGHAVSEALGIARFQCDFEHGQWWVTDLDTGAQWSVCDAEGPGSTDGFDFEQVTEGDA